MTVPHAIAAVALTASAVFLIAGAMRFVIHRERLWDRAPHVYDGTHDEERA